jgi:hypothetical protein
MTPVGAETFDDEKTDEGPARVGRGVPIAELVISGDLRLQVESVHDSPAAGLLGIEPVVTIVRVKPKSAHLGAMFPPRRERQRLVDQAGSKTDVGEKRTLGKVDFDQHVFARTKRRVGWRHPANARAQPGGFEADRLQRRLEQGVLLEAIAAAPAFDELAPDRGGVEADRRSDQRVDALERDCANVRGVQAPKRREVGRDRSFAVDSREIDVEREVGQQPSPARLRRPRATPPKLVRQSHWAPEVAHRQRPPLSRPAPPCPVAP